MEYFENWDLCILKSHMRSDVDNEDFLLIFIYIMVIGYMSLNSCNSSAIGCNNCSYPSIPILLEGQIVFLRKILPRFGDVVTIVHLSNAKFSLILSTIFFNPVPVIAMKLTSGKYACKDDNFKYTFRKSSPLKERIVLLFA